MSTKEKMNPKKISWIVLGIGLLTALTGAYIMFRGDIFLKNNLLK